MIKLLDNQTLDRHASPAVQSPRTSTSDALLRRAAHLTRDDQMLIELSVRSGLTYRRIGQLLEIPSGTISRRLHRLGSLLHDPLIVRLLDGPCPLDRDDRQIAIGYFLRRESLRDLSLVHRLPPAQIARKIQFVKGWFRGATLSRDRPS
jgi:hypothetical protein